MTVSCLDKCTMATNHHQESSSLGSRSSTPALDSVQYDSPKHLRRFDIAGQGPPMHCSTRRCERLRDIVHLPSYTPQEPWIIVNPNQKPFQNNDEAHDRTLVASTPIPPSHLISRDGNSLFCL
jgi:hypothetical protein